MNLSLPRSSILTIYKSFVRPHLDYGDVIYDQPNNSSLSDKIDNRRTSKKKLYQELGLEYLSNRSWLERMSYLFKIIWTKLPLYLYELIAPPPTLRGHIVTLIILKLCAAGLDFSETWFYRLLSWNGY